MSYSELRSSVRIFYGIENITFRCCATPTILPSMPMLQCIELTWNKLICLCKSLIGILKNKNVFRWHQFQSFDDGSVRIKGTKTLYLSVIHSKHTASYTGQHLLDLMRRWMKNSFWLVNQTYHQPLGQQAEKLVSNPAKNLKKSNQVEEELASGN